MGPDRRRLHGSKQIEIDGLKDPLDADAGMSDLLGGGGREAGTFDIRHYLAMVRRRWRLILGVALLGLAIGGWHAVSEQEFYRSQTRLLLESGGGLVVMNQKLTYVPSQSMNTFVEILRTENVLKKVLTRLNLPMSAAELRSHIEFTPQHQTNILQIAVTHPQRELAQSICREVAAVAVDEVDAIYSSSTGGAYQTLGEQLEKTKIQLMKAEERIKDFVRSKGYRNLKNENSARLSRLSSLTNTYNDSQVSIRVAETGLDYEAARLAMTDSLIVKEATYSTPLHVEIINLETELAKLLTNYTEEHPRVRSLRRSVDRLRSMMESNTERGVRVETRAVNPIRQDLVQQLAQGRTQVMREKARQSEIRRLINEIEERLRTAPEDNLALARLEREKAGLENTYFSMLRKYEEARMVKETAQGNLQILEPADISQSVLPNMILMMIAGYVLGGIVGGVLALVIENLDPRVKFNARIERQVGTPIVGVIPRFEQDERYVDFSKPRARIAEAYNIVRANIEYSFPKRDSWSLVITSGFQGEGKTLTAVNLARSMAVDGRKVVLIDADLRRTYLHQIFLLERDGGLCEYLSDELTADEILKDTEIGGFKVITAGRQPVNPARLLNSERFDQLLEHLRANDYYVIIDSPAVLPIVDTSLIASRVDGLLLILKEGATQRHTAQKTVERLRRVGANFVGALLNSASESGFGYYHYYGYRYTETYGYAEEAAEVQA